MCFVLEALARIVIHRAGLLLLKDVGTIHGQRGGRGGYIPRAKKFFLVEYLG